MDLRIFCEPQQGASYADILALALASEAGGFDAFFRSDHYYNMGSGSGLPGPSDAWTTLAGLARDTTRVRLGTLVSSATFRLPGPLAIAVANVDEMSGGRVELGLGAGWYPDEHSAYGIAFAPVGERFDRLEEQLSIITGLWRTELDHTFDFSGRYYSLTNSPALPKPTQSPHPPIIVGGHGAQRTPRLAARFANEFNIPFASLEACRAQFSRVDDACRAIHRDPSSVTRSVALVVCCADNQRDLARRSANIGRETSELSRDGLAGSPEQIIERIANYQELGVTRIYLQILDMRDLDHVALIASSVLPILA